jgi:predicted transcriptional regulator
MREWCKQDQDCVSSKFELRKCKTISDKLINNGFMEVVPDGSRVVYRTTMKGLELNEKFKEFHSEIDKLYA